jgi:hypothetical protein
MTKSEKMEKQPLQELDLVTLKRDLASKNLLAGDIGTVVFVYDSGKAYEVEFVAANGETLAVETLGADAIAPFAGSQIMHARPLASA